MSVATNSWLNKIAKEKTQMLQDIIEMEPRHVDVKHPITKKSLPRQQGEHMVYLWDKLYACDPRMTGIVVETVTGPSTPDKDYYDDINANPVMPYQQLRAILGDGGKWKWPEIWKQLDLLPRRGPAWRHIDDPSNLGKIENPNPNIVPLNCLVVGGGPVGLRLAIELVLGGHRVTLWEKRREVVDEKSGLFESVGFTNRVNRPHINNFCRNDLDRLNGRNFMTAKMCYPVFTNAHTSSIGIDESQMLLMKTAFLLGVKFCLGIGYEGAEIDIENEQNQRPSWMVSFKCDAVAQERYNKPETGEERFDALFGCDGGGSRVRKTQSDWLGEPKIRVYKKMFGIVSNIRKVSKAKLKELGFSDGLEPEDRAGRTTGVFFYKASYHNYFIVHPSAEEMEANGIPWKALFGFHKARGGMSEEKEELKKTYKKYIIKKAKELNIPIDETLENDGFVDAPNDVMGFDFSEFYNCEKSAACSVPPLDWDLDKDGEWEVQCPLIALAGDAVADPNWLLGVGLQRGWNTALDATFYADNLYNNKTFIGKPHDKSDPVETPVEWSQHMDNMMNLMEKLGHNAREGKLSEEMDTGMLKEKGPVVVQIRKHLSARAVEAPVPQYQPPVEPWFRYNEFQLVVNRNYKGKDLFENQHPLAVREIAIFEHNEKYVERGDRIKKAVTRPTAAMLTWPKRFECSAFWGMMKLLQIDGKVPPGQKPLEALEESKETKAPEAGFVSPRPKMDVAEVREKAMRKSFSLRENALKAAIAGRTPTGREDQAAALFFQKPPPPPPPPPPGSPPDSPISSPFGSLNHPPPPPPPLPSGSQRGLPSGSQRGSIIGGYAMSSDDMAAITKLSEQLSKVQINQGAGAVGATEDFNEVKMLTVKHEQEALQAKLEFAEAEVLSVQAQQEALNAKLVYAKKEVELVKKSLEAYQKLEAKLKNK